MKRIPSVATIETDLRVSRDTAGKVRAILERIRDYDQHAPLAPCSLWLFTHARLSEISEAIGGYGVEILSGSKRPAFYVNTGDTYSPTILVQNPGGRWRQDSVFVTSWGDWVEAEERRGNRFE